MGDILEFCQKLLYDENFEGVFVPQNKHNNNSINKKSSDTKLKESFIPLNSTLENNFSSINNRLKNININTNNSDEIHKISINKNGYISGRENDLVTSYNKMRQIIESLENKNKILEKEKNDIQKENDKLLKEIKIYKDKISKLKNKSNEKENIKEKNNNDDENNNIIQNKDKKIKIIFLFKNNKNINENEYESQEEIIAYKYEMFIEVKLRLLNLKNLGPTDIKACYYNSKQINDWLTLQELNIDDNAYIICEYS